MTSKLKLLLVVLVALPFFSSAQENSPYSRYGVGNLQPQGNVLNRAMGGISAAYSDISTINFINPASYGNLLYTTLDIGAEVDSRTLKSVSPLAKFTSNNALFSYIQIGVPLVNLNRTAKTNKGWGINFGLKPVSKINYKISNFGRISNIDSVATIYEGTGGINEAFVGTGVKIKDFSFGFNVGYLFGNKNYSTRLIFINDTVNYLKSNSSTKTSFGGLSFNAGLQYSLKIKEGILKLGAHGSLQRSYSASQDILRESFSYNGASGATDKLDSIYELSGKKGTVVLPANYAVGFMVEKPHVSYGLDFELANWDNYSFYNQRDNVKNTWKVKGGFQYLPASATSASGKYWDFVKYRAGFFAGPDYITANKNLPQYGVTIGGGFPLKLKRSFYETQYSVMNLALEYNTRGNASNNIRENILRVCVGFSLSDVWFRRYKYN